MFYRRFYINETTFLCTTTQVLAISADYQATAKYHKQKDL